MGGAQGNSLLAKISDKTLCPALKKRAQEILSTQFSSLFSQQLFLQYLTK